MRSDFSNEDSQIDKAVEGSWLNENLIFPKLWEWFVSDESRKGYAISLIGQDGEWELFRRQLERGWPKYFPPEKASQIPFPDWFLAEALRQENSLPYWLNEFFRDAPKREIHSLVWIAKTIKEDPGTLAKLLVLARHQPDRLYRERVDGGDKKKRMIHIPAPELKTIQEKLNKAILSDFLVNSHAYGFSGGSIDNAIQPHLNSKVILCLDFKDAFPTVNQDWVFSSLLGERWLVGNWREIRLEKPGNMSWYAARIIRDLTTYQNCLPQGAPTSPRLFDLVCKEVDKRLTKLAKNVSGVYTRYADNIFFSMRLEEIPPKVERAVFRTVKKEGFTPHKIRTIPMEKGVGRILGLNIIGGKVHNTRAFKRRLRLTLHYMSWLLGQGLNYEETWQKLQGQMAFARKDTLPKGLMETYSKIQERV